MSTPMVSVIIPTFKRPKLVVRAVSSVLAQSFEDFEIIVVDDNHAGSEGRESTAAAMVQFQGDARVKYHQHPENKGLPGARNTGINDSSGTFVAFLDDDDEWLPEKLAMQVRVARASEAIGLVYTGVRSVNSDDGRVIDSAPDPRGLTHGSLLGGNYIRTPSSVLCRRVALVEVGLFDEAYPSLEDWDLYVRLSEKYEFAMVSEPVTVYYRHSQGRMMEDYTTLVSAFGLMYERIRTKLQSNPRAHADFLRRHGEALDWSGNKAQAIAKIVRSITCYPLDRRGPTLLFKVLLGKRLRSRLRDVQNRIR